MSTEEVVGARRSWRGSDVPFRWFLLDGVVWLFRTFRLHRLGQLAGYVMLVPAIAVLSVLVASLVYLTWIGFHKFDPFLSVQGGLSTQNFGKALHSDYYRQIFLRTITVTCAVTAIAVAVALPLAYTMVRTRSRLARIGLLVVVFLPFLVGEVVRAYAWLVMIGGNGAVPWFMRLIGFDGKSLLGTGTGVSLGLLQLMVPLCALTLLPAIHAIDSDLEQAATVMGARSWQTWRYVILPLARPGLAAASAVSFTLCMTSYAVPDLLGNGQYDFIANAIANVYLFQGQSYLAAAMGVVVLLVVSVSVALIFWLGNPSRKLRARWTPRRAG